MDEISRSGHDTGFNSDRYVDCNNPVATVPGEKCLSGYRQCKGLAFAPSLDHPDLNSAERHAYVDKLVYYNSQHDNVFGQRGTHRPIIIRIVAQRLSCLLLMLRKKLEKYIMWLQLKRIFC